MTYRERYNEIINYRKENPLPDDVYGENHHVIPRSLHGTNNKENIVRLLPEEHYKCHCLLPYVYLEEGNENGYQKMLHAWIRLSSCPQPTHPNLDFIDKDAEIYGELRRAYAKLRSKTMKGHVPWNKGIKLPTEIVQRMAKGHIGLQSWNKGIKMPDEIKTKISEALKGEKNPFYGKKHSDESLKKMSEGKCGAKNPTFGKRYFCNPERTEHILAYECPEGWIPGMKYTPRKKVS